MKKTIADDFAQFFIDQTPKFDELIMESIRPADTWVPLPRRPASWWLTRESVRKIVEGNAYTVSRKVWSPQEYKAGGDGGWLLNVSIGTIPQGMPVEVIQDRFRAVWPNVSEAWRPVTR